MHIAFSEIEKRLKSKVYTEKIVSLMEILDIKLEHFLSDEELHFYLDLYSLEQKFPIKYVKGIYTLNKQIYGSKKAEEMFWEMLKDDRFFIYGEVIDNLFPSSQEKDKKIIWDVYAADYSEIKIKRIGTVYVPKSENTENLVLIFPEFFEHVKEIYKLIKDKNPVRELIGFIKDQYANWRKGEAAFLYPIWERAKPFKGVIEEIQNKRIFDLVRYNFSLLHELSKTNKAAMVTFRSQRFKPLVYRYKIGNILIREDSKELWIIDKENEKVDIYKNSPKFKRVYERKEEKIYAYPVPVDELKKIVSNI